MLPYVPLTRKVFTNTWYQTAMKQVFSGSRNGSGGMPGICGVQQPSISVLTMYIQIWIIFFLSLITPISNLVVLSYPELSVAVCVDCPCPCTVHFWAEAISPFSSMSGVSPSQSASPSFHLNQQGNLSSKCQSHRNVTWQFQHYYSVRK